MKSILLLLLIPSFAFTQIKTGKDLIIALHKKYEGKPCKTVAFKQKTIRYQNDTIASTSVWTEYLSFPDKLKIIFGDSAKGSYTVFKNDSAFHYRSHKFSKNNADKNLIMLLLGGMYYRKKDDVLKRLQEFKIDLDSLCILNVDGKECYVIGVSNENPNKPQIRINKKTMQMESFIEDMNGTMIEVKVADRQKACGADLETKLLIYADGKLMQEEHYYEVQFNPKLPANTFETK